MWYPPVPKLVSAGYGINWWTHRPGILSSRVATDNRFSTITRSRNPPAWLLDASKTVRFENTRTEVIVIPTRACLHCGSVRQSKAQADRQTCRTALIIKLIPFHLIVAQRIFQLPTSPRDSSTPLLRTALSVAWWLIRRKRDRITSPP